MEFLDEESRPKLLFQSRSIPTTPQNNPNTTTTRFISFHKPTLLISLPLSILLFFLSLFYFKSEPLQSIFFWLASSLFLGPFAPSSITAGDIRVGQGPLLHPPPPQDDLPNSESDRKRRLKPKKQDDDSSFSYVVSEPKLKIDEVKNVEIGGIKETSEWNDADFDVLKKQLLKNPVGMPGRWEVISEAFNGRHGVESVIKTAKSLGEKKVSDSDSFDRFLKNRKPVDKRVEDEINSEMMNEKARIWSSGEDIALLNALKAFPKDVSMRWEKITAAVPGKSKADCMSRVAELKRDFRSSKAVTSER